MVAVCELSLKKAAVQFHSRQHAGREKHSLGAHTNSWVVRGSWTGRHWKRGFHLFIHDCQSKTTPSKPGALSCGGDIFVESSCRAARHPSTYALDTTTPHDHHHHHHHHPVSAVHHSRQNRSDYWARSSESPTRCVSPSDVSTHAVSQPAPGKTALPGRPPTRKSSA